MYQDHKRHMASCAAKEAAGDPARHVWLADWKGFGKPYCTLYVVSPDNGWPCKIGISTRPFQRVGQIQVSVWKPIKVDYSVWCPSTKEARRLEKALHDDLSADAKWLHGEWFDLRPEDTIKLIKFKASIIGVECSDRVEDEDIVHDIAERIEAESRYYASSPRKVRIVSNIA